MKHVGDGLGRKSALLKTILRVNLSSSVSRTVNRNDKDALGLFRSASERLDWTLSVECRFLDSTAVI